MDNSQQQTIAAKKRLLCVDDEPIAREIFQGIFEGNYDIVTASTGDEALELARSFRPDVVVLDAVMPGIDGWEVCRAIKADPDISAMKVIMVSAHAVDPDHRRAGYEAGADDYIIKPYINQDLFAKVQVWTRVQQFEEELEKRLRELEAARKELEHTKQHLEHTVLERTRDLMRANQKLQDEIKERKREQEEKDSLKAQLLQAQKLEAIGQLAGGVAHDFNNLLGGIMGNAELIRNKLPPDSHLARHAGTILKCCDRGATLVRQLLIFARRRVFSKKLMVLNDTVRDVAELLGPTLDKRIRLSLDLAAACDTIMGDQTHLHTALLNLATNASDAMPRGGTLTLATQNLTVDWQYREKHNVPVAPGDYIVVSVTDTGAGMDEDTRQKAFEPFFTTKQVGKGSGLGLASVYGCVAEHDGHVDVESALGKGSVFRMYLPLTPQTQPSESAPQTAPTPIFCGRALVVDDDLMMREACVELLETLGFSVVSYENGERAAAFFRCNPSTIDLIVLDMMMPVMDGGTCFAQLREINPTVPIIISSGIGRNQEIDRVLAHLYTVFLQKPFNFQQLAHTIEHILQPRAGAT